MVEPGLLSRPPVAIGASPYSGGNPLSKYFDSVDAGPGIWKWSHYFDVYHKHLARFRGTNATIVEIGIYSGGSLRLWRSYLGPHARIVGVDISPAVRVYERNPAYGSPDHIFVGDQANGSFIREMMDSLSPKGHVDILLDDGGHELHQQNATLHAAWQRLARGGVYICEDLLGINHAFAREVYENYVAAPHGLNSFDASRRATARCLRKQAANPLNRQSCLYPPLSATQAWTAGVSFYPLMVVLEKNPAASPGLVTVKHGTKWQPPLHQFVAGHRGPAPRHPDARRSTTPAVAIPG